MMAANFPKMVYYRCAEQVVGSTGGPRRCRDSPGGIGSDMPLLAGMPRFAAGFLRQRRLPRSAGGERVSTSGWSISR